MKYIDADKLKAEIERRIAAYQKNFDKANNKIARLSTDGRIAGLKSLLTFITSLQQDKAAVELGQGSQVLAEFMEKASEIGKKYNYGFGPNLSSLQQEQSEVDIEKEIEEYLINNSDFLVEQDSKAVVHALARHFYELGLNTRKEK